MLTVILRPQTLDVPAQLTEQQARGWPIVLLGYVLGQMRHSNEFVILVRRPEPGRPPIEIHEAADQDQAERLTAIFAQWMHEAAEVYAMHMRATATLARLKAA